MNTIELCPSAVFGPSIMKKFGNAEVEMPSFVAAPSLQASEISTPSRPNTFIGARKSVAANPVPKTMVSTRRGEPSAATTASAVISRRPVVTSSTLLRWRAGNQSSDTRRRLHPGA